MKTTILFILCGISSLLVAQLPSEFIHVDQFGYLNTAEKVAVISNPQVGYNSQQSFMPGNVVEVRDVATNSVVYAASAVSWNNGAQHTQSGDQGWWFDFSSVSASGTYVITTNGETSPPFKIAPNLYEPVLQDVGRMFYYNRCNHSKSLPYAEAAWTDGLDFTNPLQDANCRFIDDPSNASLEKDLTGGWYDAGDYNKYVTFAATAVHNLLMAYEENPQAFGDNWNIPESGNGIPDVLDEARWELEWLMKMSNSDGTVHVKMGSQNYSENTSSPPSLNTDPRFYGPTCTAASICLASNFAQAAHIFNQFPSLQPFAAAMETRAVSAYNYWVNAFLTSALETSCDDGSIISGDADMTVEEQSDVAVSAAVYLYRLTGDQGYSSFLQSIHLGLDQISGPYWGAYRILGNDALLAYTQLNNANGTVASNIVNAITNSSSDNWNNFYGFNENDDLYRGYIPDWSYHWGSNQPKANYGNLNIALTKNGINTSFTADYRRMAAELVHYYHGVNPLGLVYLTNMYDHGVSRSCNEIYHTWFSEGSDWDNAQTSLYGPPPGYLPGGPNASNSISQYSPPYGQPQMKSYLDFNTGWPDKSWEITEPAIYYQAAYLRLLANFVDSSTISTSLQVPSNSFARINYYPNPTSEFLQVSGLKVGQQIMLIDANGKAVKTLRANSFIETLPMAKLAAGLYLLRVLDSEGSQIHQGRVIVE